MYAVSGHQKSRLCQIAYTPKACDAIQQSGHCRCSAERPSECAGQVITFCQMTSFYPVLVLCMAVRPRSASLVLYIGGLSK